MSKFRLGNKLRQNMEYPAITGYLDTIAFAWRLNDRRGNGGHPFLTITLPCGREIEHHINSTPRADGNPKAAISKLRRALRAHGYDLPSSPR